MGKIASIQRLLSTLASHLQFHEDWMLHKQTPIARSKSQHNERKVSEDQSLCFGRRYDRQRKLVIRWWWLNSALLSSCWESKTAERTVRRARGLKKMCPQPWYFQNAIPLKSGNWNWLPRAWKKTHPARTPQTKCFRASILVNPDLQTTIQGTRFHTSFLVECTTWEAMKHWSLSELFSFILSQSLTNAIGALFGKAVLVGKWSNGCSCWKKVK